MWVFISLFIILRTFLVVWQPLPAESQTYISQRDMTDQTDMIEQTDMTDQIHDQPNGHDRPTDMTNQTIRQAEMSADIFQDCLNTQLEISSSISTKILLPPRFHLRGSADQK